MQAKRRSYADEVAAKIDAARPFRRAAVREFDCAPDGTYPAFALRSRDWNDALPVAVVTGGVHGYETSGVHGALQFAQRHAGDYAGKCNLLVVPCVSPWAYERINRWNAQALDPNRNFRAGSPAQESAALWNLLQPLQGKILVHIDPHETTDSDESEFRPRAGRARRQAVRAGHHPRRLLPVRRQRAPAAGVPAGGQCRGGAGDAYRARRSDGTIIGSPVVAPGVIEYDCRALGLCAGITDARYVTTTEVYPDSRAPRRSNATMRRPPRCARRWTSRLRTRSSGSTPARACPRPASTAASPTWRGRCRSPRMRTSKPRPARCWPRSTSCWPKCGSDKTRILRAQIFLADIADFAGMNRAWDAGGGRQCARARHRGSEVGEPGVEGRDRGDRRGLKATNGTGRPIACRLALGFLFPEVPDEAFPCWSRHCLRHCRVFHRRRRQAATGPLRRGPSARDASVKPGDDFNRYASGHWIDTYALKDYETSYGSFNQLRDRAEDQVHGLVDGLEHKPGIAPGSNDQKVRDYYASFMDRATRDAAGIAPLQPVLDRIAAIRSRATWSPRSPTATWTAAARRWGWACRSTAGPEPVPGLAGRGRTRPAGPRLLPQPDARFAKIREAYVAHIQRMLGFAG